MKRFWALAFCHWPAIAIAHETGREAAMSSVDPWIATLLLLSGVLYGVGLYRLWHHAGVGRGISLAGAAAFATGWLLLAVSAFSPLHFWSDSLFTAHMIEHEIIVAVASPLLVVSRPLAAWAWAVPRVASLWTGAFNRHTAAPRLWRWITRPGPAALLHGITLWLWHRPPLFLAALENEGLHRLEHTSFLLTALLFWWAVLPIRTGSQHRIAALFWLFATSVHTGFLGLRYALSSAVIMPLQSVGAPAWGMTALEDQQWAGLIMWVPGGVVYILAALFVMASVLRPARPVRDISWARRS